MKAFVVNRSGRLLIFPSTSSRNSTSRSSGASCSSRRSSGATSRSRLRPRPTSWPGSRAAATPGAASGCAITCCTCSGSTATRWGRTTSAPRAGATCPSPWRRVPAGLHAVGRRRAGGADRGGLPSARPDL